MPSDGEDDNAYSVARVFDLDLEILFEFWHHGNIHDCVVSPVKGNLLIAGLNAEASPAARGYHFERTHPFVMFSIPVRANARVGFIRTRESWGTYEPLWYLGMDPAYAADYFGPARPKQVSDTKPFIGIEYCLLVDSMGNRRPLEYEAIVGFVIDATDGTVIDGSLTTNSQFDRAVGVPVDPVTQRPLTPTLGKLNPILEGPYLEMSRSQSAEQSSF